jgi:hypothetical protein
MGYPIHSNIFRDGSGKSQWIKTFPIQVAVIFSPRDEEFKGAFRELFSDLDKLTGSDLIFFALLDPPEEWIEIAKRREEWYSYWKKIPVGFDFNDPMLIYELTRQFGVQWDDLPVIVISTNLWTTEYIISKTSPYHIESQLKALTKLAKQKSEPGDLDMGYLIESLQDNFGYVVDYHPADYNQRINLTLFYDILEIDPRERIPGPIFNNMVDLYYSIIRTTNEIRTYLQNQDYPMSLFDLPGIDRLLREISGQLTPYVAINEKLINEEPNKKNDEDASIFLEYISSLNQHENIIDLLDDESYTMIIKAIRHALFELHPEIFEPMLLRGKKPRKPLEEFSCAGIELWKTFEREMNKSIVQAFRSARTIEMPQYFARYRPHFKGNNIIDTPGKKLNINRKDWEDPNGDRHRFLTIGEGYHSTLVMQRNPKEQFDNVIRGSIGNPYLPQPFLDDWHRINQIRNPPSHSELLSRDEFKELANRVLNPKNLDAILRIKKHLSP